MLFRNAPTSPNHTPINIGGNRIKKTSAYLNGDLIEYILQFGADDMNCE
jgi:hypothetical protein